MRDAGIATELQGSRSKTGSGSRDWEQVDGGRGTETGTEAKKRWKRIKARKPVNETRGEGRWTGTGFSSIGFGYKGLLFDGKSVGRGMSAVADGDGDGDGDGHEHGQWHGHGHGDCDGDGDGK